MRKGVIRVSLFVVGFMMVLSSTIVRGADDLPEIVCLYDESVAWGDLSAKPVNGQDIGGTFVIPEGKRMVIFGVVNIPSGGAGFTSEFRVKIFKWNETYDKTVKGTPVFTSETIADIADNQSHYLTTSSIPSGKYLWLMEIDSGYAPWVVPAPSQAAESVCYFNGVPINGWYRVCVMFRSAEVAAQTPSPTNTPAATGTPHPSGPETGDSAAGTFLPLVIVSAAGLLVILFCQKIRAK